MRLTECDPRISQLRALYHRRGNSAIVLTQPMNLSWLLGGRMQIGIAGSGAVCTAVINDAEVVLITNNIEARRLQEEEVGDVPRILALPWADGEPAVQAQAELAGNAPLLEADCAEELQQLRSCLQGTQEQEAAQVAALCSSAVERAVLLIHPGMTEWEASGVLSGCAVANGLIPNVLFTPADEHIARYRHALSGPYPLKKTMMLSMGAQKNGLYASITRFVSFGRPEEVFLSAQEKTCQVAAMLYSETRPGKQYGTLFAQLKRCYAKVGAGEQIALHHQGGMGGFQTRENRLTPDQPGQVQAHQLYAWNPSVTGFKSEDMLLVGENENRILTRTEIFPHKTFYYKDQAWDMPQVLIL